MPKLEDHRTNIDNPDDAKRKGSLALLSRASCANTFPVSSIESINVAYKRLMLIYSDTKSANFDNRP